KTPGRDAAESAAAPPPAAPADRARAWIAALGGAANLVSVDACTTRLRLVIAAQSAVDAAALTRLGARGLLRPAANALQVVVGPPADQFAGELRGALLAGRPRAHARSGADAAALLAALAGRA